MKDTPEKEYLFLPSAASIVLTGVIPAGLILRGLILTGHILRAFFLSGAGQRGFRRRSGGDCAVYTLRYTLPYRVEVFEKPFKLTVIQILTAFLCTYCVSFYASYCKEVKFVR